MPNADWMANIPNNDLKLRQITMPGSHDAGVSTAHNSNKLAGWVVGPTGYICQGQDIAGQLASGSRFFDVRFDMKSGVATTVHETAGSGGWGESATSIFTSIDTFLQNHAQEIVVVRVSHTDSTAGAEVYRQQAARLHATRTFKGPTGKILANTAIRGLRGKAIVAYGSDAIANPLGRQGQTRFGKASNAARNGIVTCGEYPNSNDIKFIAYKSVKRLNEHRRSGGQTCNNHSHNDHLFMLYWQMTGGNIRQNTELQGLPPAFPLNPHALTTNAGTHYNLTWLAEMLSGLDGGRIIRHDHSLKSDSIQTAPGVDANRTNWVPNIINLDFINDTVCDRIIAFNEANLRAANLWIVVA